MQKPLTRRQHIMAIIFVAILVWAMWLEDEVRGQEGGVVWLPIVVHGATSTLEMSATSGAATSTVVVRKHRADNEACSQ